MALYRPNISSSAGQQAAGDVYAQAAPDLASMESNLAAKIAKPPRASRNGRPPGWAKGNAWWKVNGGMPPGRMKQRRSQPSDGTVTGNV